MDENYNLKFKIWIETQEGKGILGDGKWELLKLIRDEGSLMAAVEKKGYSYRKTWNKLKEIEKMLGFTLIEKSRGGVGGGSSALTEKGKTLVSAFDELHEKLDSIFQKALSDFKVKMSST